MNKIILVAGKFGDSNTIITQEAINRCAKKYKGHKIPMQHGDGLGSIYGAVSDLSSEDGKLTGICEVIYPEILNLLNYPEFYSVACKITVDEKSGELEEIVSADIVPNDKLRRK